MFSSASSKPRPPAVEVPNTIATDADEGDTDANTLLAGEAVRMLGASHANTPNTQPQQSSSLVRSTSETVLAMPDYSEQILTDSDQGVDNQPLLEWLQSSSQAQRLQRRRSEQQSTPLWPPPRVYRSMSATADAFVDSSHQQPAVNRASAQPFYGMEPRQPVKRESLSSQLLTNMRGPMRKPYRQQSLLSRGSPPIANTGRRWVSHDHETAHPAHVQEMMDMSSNPLSRITSDAPESSGGSILVEVSPDSYEPLQAAIAEMPGVLSQLPSMLEEEPERGSIHESQGSLGDKLYSVNWPQDQEAAALKEDPMVSRFSSFEAPLGGVAPSPTADNRVLPKMRAKFKVSFQSGNKHPSGNSSHSLSDESEGQLLSGSQSSSWVEGEMSQEFQDDSYQSSGTNRGAKMKGHRGDFRIHEAAFAHLPSLKEGQDTSKGAADRKKASMKPSGGVLTFLHRLRPGRPSINRVANRTPSTSHPSLDSRNAWQALSETSGSEDNKVRPSWISKIVWSGPRDMSVATRRKSILITSAGHPPFHLDSAPASMSYGQMKHPSLLNLGLRKSKHVQFVRDDQPKDPLEGGWLNSLLAMFHPAGVVMRRLDELRVILCLYEVIMLPLRLAFGTGYGLISGPSCIRKFGAITQHLWLWFDVMADLLFLMDLCLLLLSAYYTDRTANAIVASQTASVEAGQHSQTCEMHQQAGFDRKLSKVSLAEAGFVSKKELAARTMSRSKSKRDMVFMPGPTAGGPDVEKGWYGLAPAARANSASENVQHMRPNLASRMARLRGFTDIGVQQWQSNIVGHARRWPQVSHCVQRRLPQDLLACCMMYLPIIFRWPLWVWWLMQIFRLNRISKLHQFFRARELMVHVNIRHIAAFKFAVLVLGVAHWVGCLFYFLARLAGFSGADNSATWLQQFDMGTPMDYTCANNGTIFDLYGVTLYKGLNGISNLGYDPVVPERWDEMIFSIFVMLAQVGLEAYILGTLFHYVVKKDAKLEEFRRMLRSVRAYCETRSLPADLQQRLLSYFEFQQQKAMDSDGSRILRALPDSLRMKVASHQYSYVIQRNSMLFKGCNLQFLNQLMLKLREMYLMPGETLIRAGDMSRELAFVARGVIAELREDNVIRSVRSDSESSCVGEIAFFMGIAQPRTFQARSTSDVTLLVISKFDYEELVHNYPEQNDIIVTNVLSLFGLDKDGNDSSVSKDSADTISDDAKEKLRTKNIVKAAVQKRNSEALSAMTFAATLGDVDSMEHLLQRGLLINTADYDGRTTLHLAALEGNVKVLELLLQEGADPNVRDRWGHTPLQHAVSRRHGPAIEVLQKYDARLGYEDASSHLCAAAAAGDMRQLTRLIDNGVDPDVRDYDQRTAFHIAARRGCLKVVDYLVSCKAEINAVDRWGATPLQDALMGGHDLVCDLIRSFGGRLELEHAPKALGQAASAGDIRRISLLVENGVPVDMPDYDGRTALHLAATEGQLLSVYILLHRYDADVNIADRWNGTPLTAALRHGHLAIAKMLMSCEAKLGDNADPTLVQMMQQVHSDPKVPQLQVMRKQVSRILQRFTSKRADGSQLALLSATEDDSFHPLAVIETIKRLGDLRSAAFSLISTLIQILEALQPLQKLLELLNPRYDSVLRNTFEQGRLNRVLPALGATMSFSAARAGAALGAAGRYRNAAGTAGSLLMSTGPGREAGQSLRSMPGLSKGLRRARDEHGVSVWKTTSRLDKNSNKDGQPTFNCLLLQFGVVAQGVQELADLMHEVENQPATTILQVIALRLNVKLSPDQERQLLESSMVPIDEQEDHVLTIETTSAVPAPVAPVKASAPPAILGPTASGSSGQRMLLGATQSGKLVVPDWAGPTGSKAGPPPSAADDSLQQRRANAPAGPYGYQPDFMDKQTLGGKQQNGTSLSRGNSAAQMSIASRAAGGSHDGEGGALVSMSGLPISRQSSSSALLPRPPSVLGGRARRPSLLGVPPLHMSSLHALPENNAYLGSPKSRALRRTSSVLTGRSSIGSLDREPTLDAVLLLPHAKPRSPRRTSSFLTGPPSGTVTRKGSAERENMFDATMPLMPQSNVLDASLLEPEILDHAILNLPLEVSRQTTSASLEAASGPLQGPAPVVQGALSVPHLLVCQVFEELLHMATPSEGGQSYCEGVQDELGDTLMRTVNIISSFFEMLDLDKNGNVELPDLHRMQDDMGELGLLILEKAYGRFDTGRPASLDKLQFTHAFLSWLGFEQTVDGDLDESSDEAFNLQRALSLSSWPTTQALGPQGTFNSTGPPKGIAKLLTVSESGRMRSPPLVEKFRRAKENMLQNWQSQPINGKLLSLERMFHEVDSNGNGSLDSREIEVLLNSLAGDTLGEGRRVSKAEIRNVMEKVDSNKDRRIAFDEFIRVMAPLLDNNHELNWQANMVNAIERKTANQHTEGYMVPEDLPVWILLPNSQGLFWWDAMIRWLAVAFFIQIPIDIAFNMQQRLPHWYYITIQVLDFLLVMDIVLQFFRAYVNKKSVLVVQLARIRRNYLGKHFLVDFLAACPYDLLVKTAGGSVRYQAWVRIPKLLRLHRVVVWYQKKESEIDADSIRSRFRFLIPIMLGACHVMACVLWYVGTYKLPSVAQADADAAGTDPTSMDNAQNYQDQRNTTWLGGYSGFGDSDIYLQGNIGQQYLLCYYWMVATLTTNGQVGSMTPKSMLEMMFTCVSMVLTLTIFAYILGEISNLVMDQDAELVKTRSQVQGVTKFVANRNLPLALKEDISRHLEGSQVIQNEQVEGEVFSRLSHTLQVEVGRYMSRSLISVVHIFEGCNDNFLDSLSILLHEVNLSPDTYLYRMNDVSRELYIVAGGAVELLIEQDDQLDFIESTRSAGQVVGEMGFFFGMRHITHARAHSSMPTTLFALPKADYNQLVKLYPDQEEQITRNILASWQVQRSMHSEVKKVLEVAKRKKRNERVVRLVDAAARGDVAEVNFMLSGNDVEVDDGDYHQRTALHLAASSGHIVMVRHLVLIHGANMNVLDRYNGTPIMDAVRHKHSEVVAFLKRNGAVLHHDKAKGALFKACVDGDASYVELLINNGMSPSTCDYNQRTPLHLAASNGHTHIVHFLCNQAGLQLNAVDGAGNTALLDAIRHSHKEVQAALRAAGANLAAVNVADKLCLAAAENNTAILQVLIENGVDVNCADYDQRTALHVAASRGRAEVAFFLLNCPNVDINPLDRWGATPLQDAYLGGDQVMCALLERAGGKMADDPAIKDKLPAQMARQRHEKAARRHDKVQRIVQACPEVAAASQLQQVCSAVQDHVPDVEQSCIMVQWMLQEVADLGISGISWNPAKEEMEALLGKACKQAMSSLGQMSAVLAADSSRHVCGVSTTRMLCPNLTHQLDTAVACLVNIPIILEKTIQLGRENEFFFEVTSNTALSALSALSSARCVLWLSPDCQMVWVGITISSVLLFMLYML